MLMQKKKPKKQKILKNTDLPFSLFSFKLMSNIKETTNILLVVEQNNYCEFICFLG